MTSTRVEDFRLDDWLPYWLSPDRLIAALAALAVLVSLLAVLQALRGRDPFSRRYAQVAERRHDLRRAALDSKRRQAPTAAGLMRAVVMRLDLLRSTHAHQARRLLAQAGLRSNDAMVRYLFGRLSLPLGFAAVVLTDSFGPHLLPIPDRLRVIAAFGAAVLGSFAPGVFLKNRIHKRAHRMELGLPDSLDLLVICAEAGLSLDAALVRCARELEQTWPDLSEEFAITAAELTYLPERKAAFDNLNARTNMASVRGVVNTLLQTARFGTPLAHSLRILAAEFREARITRAEEKAARLPAMLTVPMILFILPTLFIVLLGPALLGVLDVFSHRGRPPVPTTIERTDSADSGDFDRADVTVIDRARTAKTDAGAAGTGSAKPRPTVLPLRLTIPAGQLLLVDIDARELPAAARRFVVLAPAGSGRRVDAGDGVAVAAVMTRISLVPRLTGISEVRLYYVPQGATAPVLAAKAAVTVMAAGGG
jgi:tight adherence protein C